MPSQFRPGQAKAPWLERGLLVYGPRKAGTTLFQNLLDGTSELMAYPAELKLKYFARHPEKASDFAVYYAKSRVTTAKSSAFNPGIYESLWAEALARRDMASLGEFIRFDAWAVRRSLAATGDPQMWCAKEVGGPTDFIVTNWRKMFPDGKVLLIVRDPLMVTRAVINDRQRKGIRLSASQIIRETLDPMRVAVAQSRYLNDPGVYLLAYEDLVADTVGTMTKVAAFLGIPYSPVLATPTLFGEAQVVRTSSRKTTEVFASAQSWTEDLTAREIRIVSAASKIAGRFARYRIDYPALRASMAQMQTA